MPATVTLTDVVKDYADVRALDHLDLSIETGRITAVLGPNGAGKTTAVDLMLGLRRPTSGRVQVLGRAADDRAVRSRVGAMLQDPGFPEATTVAEVLHLVGVAYPDPMPLHEVLEQADLAGLGGRRIAELSGGQRQRVAFGMALVGRPDVLFLDEPTVALDVDARRRFWTRIQGLAADGKTIVFTTHHLAEADEVADRVVVIHRGRVLADGSPSAVKALVAGRTIGLTSTLSVQRLAALPGVEHVDESTTEPGPRPVTLHVSDVDAAVHALVSADVPLHDLTVRDAALEDAFVHLVASAT
ncbi:ABC transporter ATP-binding protein [Salsipaludibacter albus]|uniref:ABC transporter ATP-binding protein n=1 Tax=Salsipaludibacter albus TaxID=2849650 RepID=UPI001EE3D4F2|nr:ABC transporter ATP-binding protein [Salsipaludibacter albus]MBY5162387.1 ABC transporter ATP-binding protein [Salsipaludibacter albus]